MFAATPASEPAIKGHGAARLRPGRAFHRAAGPGRRGCLQRPRDRAQAGDHIRASWSGYWLAQALALRSAPASARAAVAEAIEDAVRSGYELGVVDSLNIAAMLALVDDDPETTRRLLPQAVAMLRDQQRWDDLGARLRVAAAAELRLGFPRTVGHPSGRS
jgi:hypothetical protein